MWWSASEDIPDIFLTRPGTVPYIRVRLTLSIFAGEASLYLG